MTQEDPISVPLIKVAEIVLGLGRCGLDHWLELCRHPLATSAGHDHPGCGQPFDHVSHRRTFYSTIVGQ